MAEVQITSLDVQRDWPLTILLNFIVWASILYVLGYIAYRAWSRAKQNRFKPDE